MKREEIRPELAEPDIVTYDRTELTLDTGFTGPGTSVNPPSSRRIKTVLQRVDARRILRRLLN